MLQQIKPSTAMGHSGYVARRSCRQRKDGAARWTGPEGAQCQVSVRQARRAIGGTLLAPPSVSPVGAMAALRSATARSSLHALGTSTSSMALTTGGRSAAGSSIKMRKGGKEI
eukprot:1119075-Pleurochrysis_carterae.AAC.1